MQNPNQIICISRVVVIMTIVLVCLGCARQEAPSYSGAPAKMTIGVPRVENAAVVYAADHLGYLGKMGIVVELQEFDSGVAAVTALNEGRVDLAVAADFVFASNIGRHPNLRIIAAINSVKNTYMVVRKDRGIHAPGDLKGKRIAVTRTSIGEYFLGKFLNYNRLRLEDVTIVNMTPTMMEQEIAADTIDAAIAWDPVARRLRERLGSNAESWPAQAETPYHMTLITRDSFIKKESAAMVRLMKALIMAEKAIETEPP